MIKKLLKYIFIAVLLTVLVFLCYLRLGGYMFISKTKRIEIIGDIKAAPQLPDNFMQVYNDLYPGTLNTNAWKYFYYDLLYDKYIECPSISAATWYGAPGRHGAFFYVAQLNFVLEDNTTQQQCLNKILEKADFTNDVVGVENAAIAYFGKPLLQLKEDQLLEIIARLKNPSLFNKERRPEFFWRRVNTLKRELEKNRANE